MDTNSNSSNGRSSRLIIKSETNEATAKKTRDSRLVIKDLSANKGKKSESRLVIKHPSTDNMEAPRTSKETQSESTDSVDDLLVAEKNDAPTTGNKKLLLRKKSSGKSTTSSKKLLLKNTQTTKSQRLKVKSSTGKLRLKKKTKTPKLASPKESENPPLSGSRLLLRQTDENVALDQTINSVSEKALAMREKMSKQNSLGPVIKSAKSVSPELLRTSTVDVDKSSLSAKATPLSSKEIHRDNTTHTITDSLGQIFHKIPSAEYPLGESSELRSIPHDFFLARYPVTKDQFYDFLEETDRVSFSHEEYDEIESVSPSPNCPMVNISWNDAIEYCNWLSDRTGDLYALPTCDEWEAAARGQDSRVYPWGNTVPNSSLLCFIDGVLEPRSTAEVGYYEANKSPFDIIGMAGNVMEWTRDGFDDDRDPHILRGGSWRSTEVFCTTYSICLSFPPSKRRSYAGLRLLYIPAAQKNSYLNCI